MVERPAEATYMAECFWPDVRAEDIEQGAERIRGSASRLLREGRRVDFLGSILMPGDEVVFYLFESDSADNVREVCEHAGITFERVVESVPRSAQPRIEQ
jgi:hypothetical protein